MKQADPKQQQSAGTSGISPVHFVSQLGWGQYFIGPGEVLFGERAQQSQPPADKPACVVQGHARPAKHQAVEGTGKQGDPLLGDPIWGVPCKALLGRDEK